MKKVKFYYAELPNMGDLINPLIIKELFGCESKRHTYLTCELSGIGSGLGQFTMIGNPLEKIAKKISSIFYPSVNVWGTGFINSENGEKEVFFKKNMNFCAVRGELSKARVEKIIGQKLDIPTGDAGILADCLIKEPITKKYKIGIIPHFKEQDHPIFEEMKNFYQESVIIDLKEEPVSVVRQIAECEVIISTSLHGLIVADSFNIPNQHIVVTDNMKGDGFKYKDYYSAYGLDINTINLNKEKIPTIETIIKNYKITPEMVERKKKEMIEAFPFKK